MKIVLATGTFPPEVSGQATFVANLAEHLKQSGFDISVITYGDPADTKASYPVYFIKRTPWRWISYVWRIRQIARDADFVYAQDLVSSGFPAAFMKSRSKLILRLGGDFLWERMVNQGVSEVPLGRYYQEPKNIVEKLYLAIYKYVLRRADYIVFNTEFQRNLYNQIFKVSLEKSQVIENPVAKNEGQVSIESGSEIIFAGRFTRLKNLTRLIRAFQNIQTDKKLVLIGDGPMREKLSQMSASDPRITIIPPLPRPELMGRLAKSYLAVLPSLSELSPNFALEALSLGKPVVLTREIGLPRGIKEYCYLIEPLSQESIQKGIEYFLSERNYLEYIEKLRGFSKEFGWKEIAQKHQELFERL